MRIGIHTAQIGPDAGLDAIRTVARTAEEVGYSSIWVLDRLTAAIEPREGYGGMPDVPLPADQRRALDPFVVLAATAAVTTDVRIGTSVLVAPWYPAAILARLVNSLDVISDGRLDVGLGMGWSTDEFRAVGLSKKGNAARLEEALDVLDAYWSPGPVEYRGEHLHIVPSYNELRPSQARPPVLLAAYSEAGLDRVARRADGWNPAGMPVELLAPMMDQVRSLAAGHGRDGDALRLVVRANIHLTDRPLDGARDSYTGSIEQVIDDVIATREAGADEVILGVIGLTDVDELLDAYGKIAAGVGLVPAVATPA